MAEETGLILPLGEWVLRKSCAEAARWDKPLSIAVNLSPLQLNQPNLPQIVHEILIETGLSPMRLELEVTESALFKDYQRALDNLRRLKAMGVRIAMDDFGTGFSSLSTLQSFPFDKIKVDKSFVENIHRDARATVIVKAVLGLGRSLDIPVVAEGVETDEQLQFLRGEAKATLASRLEAVAEHRPDAPRLLAKLGKLKTPPLGVAVVARIVPGDIPAWEQQLSAGAVCTTLLYAATAMGYGANWITDWYAYDADARAALGLEKDEQVAGFVFIGTVTEAPQERVRPDVAALTSVWSG
eukprot:gene38876-biopygen25886